MVALSATRAKRLSPLASYLVKFRGDPSGRKCPASDNYRPTRKTRQQQTRLEPDQVTQIVAAYQSGATVYELADQFNCHRTTVSGMLKSRGVPMRRTSLTQAQVDRAVKLYETGLSLSKVGKLVGANAETVRQRLLTCGVTPRSSHDRRASD